MTGAVNRDFSTCRSFSEIGGRLARSCVLVICMLSLEAFLLRSALSGLPHVNLEVQVSWQAQHFVTLKVLILWRAEHFVNLEVQIWWQAQHFVNLEVHILWHSL